MRGGAPWVASGVVAPTQKGSKCRYGHTATSLNQRCSARLPGLSTLVYGLIGRPQPRMRTKDMRNNKSHGVISAQHNRLKSLHAATDLECCWCIHSMQSHIPVSERSLDNQRRHSRDNFAARYFSPVLALEAAAATHSLLPVHPTSKQWNTHLVETEQSGRRIIFHRNGCTRQPLQQHGKSGDLRRKCRKAEVPTSQESVSTYQQRNHSVQLENIYPGRIDGSAQEV